jgi:uncharacterized protein YggU (UPF0235/DUF167 family)
MIGGQNDNSPVSHCSKFEAEQGGGIARRSDQNQTAPALEGKANAALCALLAEELKIPKRNIVLERGQQSRNKLIRIEGIERRMYSVSLGHS